MRHVFRFSLIFVLALLAASSCKTNSSVPYFVGAEELPSEALAAAKASTDPVIVPGDLLNIEVSSANAAATIPFNKGRYMDADGRATAMTRMMNYGGQSNFDQSTEFYLVGANGNIEFPVVGPIHVGGMSKTQVATKIAETLYPKYLTEKPQVDIRLMNFRVTVAGAVAKPGVYQSHNERMTFLDAIAMAGDLDIRGERENILLYRTLPDGTRQVHRLNINDKNFLVSPYYNLQQNDVIYVVPNKSLQRSAWQLSPAVSATISIVGGLSSLASLIVGIINLSR